MNKHLFVSGEKPLYSQPVFWDLADHTPEALMNKTGAWLYTKWASGKGVMNEYLRSGSGTPPRSSPYKIAEIIKASPFKQDWFDTTTECLKIARPGLPIILPVTEFRDTIGVALTNIAGGADAATELKKATAAFQPVLDKSQEG